jgi:hypothetical protein
MPSNVLFSPEILSRFPNYAQDLHELEQILAQHRQVAVRDVLDPRKGPAFARESLACRMLTFSFTAAIRSERLLEAIIQTFNDCNLHAVYVLVRSHLELAALTHFACKNVKSFLGNRDADGLDSFLEQLVLGNLYLSKETEYPVKPFHIGSVVRELEAISPRIPQTYYFLSEFTHPNMGALVLSAEAVEAEGLTRFDRRRAPTDADFMQTINLAVATGRLALEDIAELLTLDVGSLA